MQTKTQGIVLKSTKFSETSIVAHIYTLDYGMLGFMIHGARSSKAKISANLFQPLYLLDIVLYYHDPNKLQKIKEVRSNPALHHIPFDIGKTAIGFFMAEVLYKTLYEEGANYDLYNFLKQTIQKLDQEVTHYANFPVFFLVLLSAYLGFFPRNNYAATHPHFNLKEGYFTDEPMVEEESIDQECSSYLSQILEADFENLENITIPEDKRLLLLNKFLDYYRFHMGGFSRLNAYQVLREVLRS